MSEHATANPRTERTQVRARFAAWLLFLFMLVVASPAAQAQDDTGNEYRVTLFPYHRISDEVTGSGYLGYVWNPEKDYQTVYLGWPVVSYAPIQWLQIWGGLVGLYTDNKNSSDKLELRPFAGVKIFVPNEAKWNIYNFPRYEYRTIQDLDTHDWNNIHRVRTRVGLEFPFASRERAWEPKTFYGLVDMEPYYRFDRDEVDPFRVRGGIGCVLTDRIRMEFIYHAQFTRPEGSSRLEYTDNIFRLNIKIGLTKGIIGRLQNPDLDD